MFDVRCQNPEHAIFSGSVQITCDKGKTFKFAGQMPKCKTPGKYCKLTTIRSQEKAAQVVFMACTCNFCTFFVRDKS